MSKGKKVMELLEKAANGDEKAGNEFRKARVERIRERERSDQKKQNG